VLRLAEARILGIEPLERLLVSTEAEEPVLLFEPAQLEVRVVGTVPIDDLRLGQERVVAVTEPAGVDTLVNVPGRLRALDHLDRCDRVIGIGGADEAVVADAVAVEGVAPHRCQRVHELAWLLPEIGRRALDLRGVLVHPGEKSRVVAHQAVVAREGVGADRLEQ
jgi:hypothetical protein